MGRVRYLRLAPNGDQEVPNVGRSKGVGVGVSTTETCPGSGQSINAFPGEDVCPVCQKWVKVRQDSTIGKHSRKRLDKK